MQRQIREEQCGAAQGSPVHVSQARWAGLIRDGAKGEAVGNGGDWGELQRHTRVEWWWPLSARVTCCRVDPMWPQSLAFKTKADILIFVSILPFSQTWKNVLKLIFTHLGRGESMNQIVKSLCVCVCVCVFKKKPGQAKQAWRPNPTW